MHILIQLIAWLVVLVTTFLVGVMVVCLFVFEQAIELVKASFARRRPKLVWEEVKVDNFKEMALHCHAQWVAFLKEILK